MKCSAQLLRVICITMICGSITSSCRKNPAPPADPGDPGPTIPGSSFHIDSTSNHLRFINATRKQGLVPKGAGGANLKISFEDTLDLTDQVNAR